MKNNFPKDTSKYKLIVSDFDGTLAGADHVVTPKIIQAVKRWMDSGKFFTIATGRSYQMLDDECKRLELVTPVVVRGGAEVVDPTNDKVLHSEYMPEEDVTTILQMMRKSKLFKYAIEDKDKLYLDFDLVGIFPKIKYMKPSEFIFKSIPKIHVKPINNDIKPAEDFIKEMVFKLPNVHAIATHNNKFGKGWDITSVKATKLHGIVKVMEYLKVKRDEIVGVGDSYNDFPLLEAAKLKVAMGNAHDELKEIADVIVPSHEDDGVAFLIDRLLNNSKA